jgi:hypothetical protein
MKGVAAVLTRFEKARNSFAAFSGGVATQAVGSLHQIGG